MAILVAIIEDDNIVRHHLAKVINESSSCELSGIASNWLTALQLINEKETDVFLIDLGLPDCDGIELIKIITNKYPNSQSMVLSAMGDVKHILKSFEAGATGYLLKNEHHDNLIEKIIQLHNGTSPVSASVARILIQKIIITSSPQKSDILKELNETYDLSRREIDIFLALDSNMQVKDIARHFNISKHTTNHHLRNIYKKLGVNSRMAAINEIKKYGKYN